MHRFSSTHAWLWAIPLITMAPCYANATTWQEHINLANKAYAFRDYSGAAAQCTVALKQAEQMAPDDPKLVISLNYLARIYSNGGENRGRVESLCKRAMAIIERKHGQSHPDLLTPLHLLTETYVLDDKFEMADLSLSRAMKIDKALSNSNSPDAEKRKLLAACQLNLIGIYYFARSHLSQAEEIYSAAILLSPKSSGIYVNRGQTRCKLHNQKGAEADFAEAKRLGFPH